MTDSEGNASNKLHMNTFTIDRTTPTITFKFDTNVGLRGEPNSEGTALVEWEDPATNDLNGLTDDGWGPRCSFNGEEIDCASSDTRFKRGITSVSYLAKDKAGNVQQVTFRINVEVESAKAPEIAVLSLESGVEVPDGGTDDQGNQVFGTPKTVTYTVSNTGSVELDVSNIATSIPDDGNVTDVKLSKTRLKVPAKGKVQFEVTYTPTQAGPFNFDLVLNEYR